MLLNEKRIMATLQELNSRLGTIKNDLTTYEEDKKNAINELREAKATVKNLNSEIRDLTAKVSAFDTVMANQTDDAIKRDLEEQKKELQRQLEERTQERDRLLELGRAKKEAEGRIEKANEEIQSIIDEFASDPRINKYLQEDIEIKYNEQIEAKKEQRADMVSLHEKFSLDLQNDKVFGALVADFVKNYAEQKKLPTFALSEDAKKRASTVRGALTRSQNKLLAAIASRSEYKDLVLTSEDLEAIVAGPNAEGKYVIPSFEESIKNIDKAIVDIGERKVKVIERIQKALVSERIDPALEKEITDRITEQLGKINDADKIIDEEDIEIKKLEDAIKDLESKFTVVNTSAEEKALSDAQQALKDVEKEIRDNGTASTKIDKEIEALDTKISAEGFDKARLEELLGKADIPVELTDAKIEAEQEYEEALKALKDKGYIDGRVYPALVDCKDQFDAFKDADLAVRKAFLECQTTDNPDAKENLKKAMEDYQKASAALLSVKGMEGLTVENWHDYLVRVKREEARSGEIEEEYYDGVVKSRLARLAEEYKGVDGISYDDVNRLADELSAQQEAFLKGEKVEFSDVEKNLKEYDDSMNTLFTNLKAKGVKALNSLSDLYGKLTAKLATSRLGNLFSRVKNFFTGKRNTSKRISGSKKKSEREENNALLETLSQKKRALEDAETDIQEHLEGTLSQDEINELREQQEKEKSVIGLLAQKQEKEDEKSELGVKHAELLTKKKDAEELVQKKQEELDAAKAKGTATPEQQTKLATLKGEKLKHETAKNEAEKAKKEAEQAKADLEKQKSELKPTRPDSVVKGGEKVGHRQGDDLVAEALHRFDPEEER